MLKTELPRRPRHERTPPFYQPVVSEFHRPRLPCRLSCLESVPAADVTSSPLDELLHRRKQTPVSAVVTPHCTPVIVQYTPGITMLWELVITGVTLSSHDSTLHTCNSTIHTWNNDVVRACYHRCDIIATAQEAQLPQRYYAMRETAIQGHSRSSVVVIWLPISTQ